MKTFTLKQVFSIVDGRLSDTMDDVFQILGEVAGDQSITTTGLMLVMDGIKRKDKPEWYIEAETTINKIKNKVGNNFEDLMNYIDKHHSNTTFIVNKIK